MGGGAAVMLTMQLRNMAPEFADARCVAIACPACMTHELAVAVSPFVTSVINGTDIVPTFCSGGLQGGGRERGWRKAVTISCQRPRTHPIQWLQHQPAWVPCRVTHGIRTLHSARQFRVERCGFSFASAV